MNISLEQNNVPDWLADLSEGVDLECKLAQGKNGRGELPKTFWETYSAFANTHGGVVLLGIREVAPGQFKVAGIADTDRVIGDLFNALNNRQKISSNLVSDEDVEVLRLNGKAIIKITVPAASRTQKPVHIGLNPFGSTYRRLHEGDRACDDETVRRMLAERVEDERDARILRGYSWDDIDKNSFAVYRQMLRDAKPGHPFLELDDFGLLKRIRGWRRDRETGKDGMTLAGLLMFGRWDAIQDAAPNYFLDYQERPEAKAELRWVDRLVPDGSWSGNIFDFYRIVYRKLVDPDTLKVPFKLSSGQRQDDTPVHEAIREALVNTLVHADYSGRVSVLVVKRPDMFGFRNPGDMRVPQERAIRGGESDCRNSIMHQMFLMVGLGERAGSGVPKIYRGWDWRQWRKPALYEVDEPQQTLLELRMLELFPAQIHQELQDQFGDIYTSLPKLQRLILATAATEQVVSHHRIAEISTVHGHDITQALGALVRMGMLDVHGHGKGSVYHLPGAGLPTPEEVFGQSLATIGQNAQEQNYSDDKAIYSDNKEGISGNSAASSDDYRTRISGRDDTDQHDAQGRLVSKRLKAPVIHDLAQLDADFLSQLEMLAQRSRRHQRLPTDEMTTLILAVCDGHYMTRSCLAELLQRKPESLRQQYLTKMVREKQLLLAFPQNPNDKRQAYIATASLNRDE